MAERQQYTPVELAKHLEEMAKRQRDPLPYVQSSYPLILKLLQSQSRKAFHTQTSPTGQGWAPLAHTRARGSSGHVLRDTGELMASLTGGQYSINKLEGTAITYGSESIKGFHDRGGVITRKRSRFLTLPATKEALYAGGMRNFPRRLSIIWNEATGKGIAFERVKKARKAKRVSQKGKKRKKLSWLGKKLAKAKKAAKAFLKRVRGYVKRKKKRTARTSARTTKPKSTIIVHYYLRAFVIIPQRKFLEVSQETRDKIGKILVAQMFKHMKGQL